MKVNDVSSLKELKERISDLPPDELALIYENCEDEYESWEDDIEKSNVISGTPEYREVQDRLHELDKMMAYITKYQGYNK